MNSSHLNASIASANSTYVSEEDFEYMAYLRAKLQNIALKDELKLRQRQCNDQLMMEEAKFVENELRLQEVEAKIADLESALKVKNIVEQTQQAVGSVPQLTKVAELHEQLESVSRMLITKNVKLFNGKDAKKRFVQELKELNELLEKVSKVHTLTFKSKIAAQILKTQETMKSFKTANGIYQSTEYMVFSDLLAKLDDCFRGN